MRVVKLLLTAKKLCKKKIIYIERLSFRKETIYYLLNTLKIM